jgi:hypothetical protein
MSGMISLSFTKECKTIYILFKQHHIDHFYQMLALAETFSGIPFLSAHIILSYSLLLVMHILLWNHTLLLMER